MYFLQLTSPWLCRKAFLKKLKVVLPARPPPSGRQRDAASEASLLLYFFKKNLKLLVREKKNAINIYFSPNVRAYASLKKPSSLLVRLSLVSAAASISLLQKHYNFPNTNEWSKFQKCTCRLGSSPAPSSVRRRRPPALSGTSSWLARTRTPRLNRGSGEPSREPWVWEITRFVWEIVVFLRIKISLLWPPRVPGDLSNNFSRRLHAKAAELLGFPKIQIMFYKYIYI